MNEGTRFGTTMHSPKVVQNLDAYPPIHGRQDKSADRGRAHVVGGIEVSGNLSLHRAGARVTMTNDFNGPSAITRINAKGPRP